MPRDGLPNEALRKNLMSEIFPPLTLGPKLAAPILWRLRFLCFFLLEEPNAHKIPRFRVGGWFFFGGRGGNANFIFMGSGVFLKKITSGRN